MVLNGSIRFWFPQNDVQNILGIDNIIITLEFFSGVTVFQGHIGSKLAESDAMSKLSFVKCLFYGVYF